MSGRRKPEEPQEEGAPAWMNTYGDMVTLVLTFFVLLFSFSTIDKAKWEDVANSMAGMTVIAIPALDPDAPDKAEGQGKFVLTSSPPYETVTNTSESQGNETGLTNEEITTSFNEMYARIKAHITENSLSGILDLQYLDQYTVLLRMSDSAFFDSGSDGLRPDAEIILQEVCGILEEYSYLIKTIRVEGHTDNVPISNAKFKDNWDLSMSRAGNVVRYIIEATSLNPSLLSSTGYGEYRPIADNNTEEGKAKNRRVDFVIESILKK